MEKQDEFTFLIDRASDGPAGYSDDLVGLVESDCSFENAEMSGTVCALSREVDQHDLRGSMRAERVCEWRKRHK